MKLAHCSIAAALLLTACAKFPRITYMKELRKQTELAEVYVGFGTALRVRAVYLSASFRDVLSEERSRLMDASAEDQARYEAMHDADLADFHEVVFAAESDLEQRTTFSDRGDGWIIELTADGEPQELVSIHRIRRPSALDLQLYAFDNIWTELWVARFARQNPSPDSLTFKVASGFGHKSVTWDGEHVK